jgi:tetratricopeptide (TPR) repeat protein
MKYLVWFISFWILLSCRNEEGLINHNPDPMAIELNNRALKIGLYIREDSIDIDSALFLLNQSIAIDSLYYLAYENKVQFLLKKNDFNGLMTNFEEMQRLQPKNPHVYMQQGLVYELFGHDEEALELYERGIVTYDNIEDQGSLNFLLDYASSLVLANDFEKAMEIVEKARINYPNSRLWEGFELPTKAEVFQEAGGIRKRKVVIITKECDEAYKVVIQEEKDQKFDSLFVYHENMGLFKSSIEIHDTGEHFVEITDSGCIVTIETAANFLLQHKLILGDSIRVITYR